MMTLQTMAAMTTAIPATKHWPMLSSTPKTTNTILAKHFSQMMLSDQYKLLLSICAHLPQIQRMLTVQLSSLIPATLIPHGTG